MAKYIDLTLPFDGLYRFGIEFRKDRTHEIDERQTTRYAISAHAFTHLDAPLHFVRNGKSIDSFPVDYFIGDAVLLDLPRGENQAITADDMERAGGHAKNGDIVLIRTGWLEKMWNKPGFINSPYLTNDAAEWLVKLKARFAGYDFVEEYELRNLTAKGSSPDLYPYGDEAGDQKNVPTSKDFTVHRILLSNGVLNLEYLNNLSKITQPRMKLIALPIPLKDSDGAS